MLSPLVLALALAAPPPPADLDGRDGLFVEAASVALPGTVRVATGGGAAPSSDGGTAGDGQLAVRMLWTVMPRLAAAIEANNDGARLTPGASLRYQVLAQPEAGVNAVALVRFKSVGFRTDGNELAAGAVVGRTLGPLALTAAGVAGRGLDAGHAVDVEAKGAVAWRFDDSFRAGAEARYRRELGSEADAPAIAGRDYDLVAGPTLAWRHWRVDLQAIGGLGVPRGTAAAGPMGMLLVSVDL
jgi:hypothetical protein